MKHLVLGSGEIGRALGQVLCCNKDNVVEFNDPYLKIKATDWKYDYIHVCFPYGGKFVKEVKRYVEEFGHRKSIVVIHSTVKVGTSRLLGAVYSPCRGVHPELFKGLRTFVKYVGCEKFPYRAEKVANELEKCGVNTQILESCRDAEALKLWDTTQYGWNIILEKVIYEWCKRKKISYDVVYKHANMTYNEGYLKYGKPAFQKYNINHVEGTIGGHCILPNCKLLDNWLAKEILFINEHKQWKDV